MTNDRIFTKEEVTILIFRTKEDKMPIIEQETVELTVNVRNGKMDWGIEFFPDYMNEPLWEGMVNENSEKEHLYFIQIVKRGIIREGFAKLRGNADNPCKMQGLDTLVRLKK